MGKLGGRIGTIAMPGSTVVLDRATGKCRDSNTMFTGSLAAQVCATSWLCCEARTTNALLAQARWRPARRTCARTPRGSTARASTGRATQVGLLCCCPCHAVCCPDVPKHMSLAAADAAFTSALRVHRLHWRDGQHQQPGASTQQGGGLRYAEHLHQRADFNAGELPCSHGSHAFQRRAAPAVIQTAHAL